MRICVATTCSEDMALLKETAINASPNYKFDKFFSSCKFLSSIISDDLTDILIVDTQLPDGDVFACIEAILHQKPIQVILVTPEADFHTAYRALRLRVNDILVRPLTPMMLENAIFDASKNRTASISFLDSPRRNSRSEFARELMHILSKNKELSELNAVYGTSFHDGLFQVLTLTLDFPDPMKIPQMAKELWHSMHREVECALLPLTYDLVHCFAYNEIRLVVNYPARHSAEIERTFTEILFQAKTLCSPTSSLFVFMGIGQAYDSISLLTKSCEESKVGTWARLNPVLSGAQLQAFAGETLLDQYVLQLRALKDSLQKSIDELNIDMFKHYMGIYFKLPESVLSTSLAKDTFFHSVSYLFATYREKLSETVDPDLFFYQMKLSLLAANSYSKLHLKSIECCSKLFDLIHTASPSPQEQSVNMAKLYITKNYMGDISQQTVAAYVGLSTGYFCRLFKKETGVGFSDYCLNYRLGMAKQLLTQTNYSIKKVSIAVGYEDQRYFSKLFRSKYGMTPSDYRKLRVEKPKA